MFEFEEMSSGFHEGFLSKYADSSGPIYDIFISDSMQDMLDIDIRSEVATVVGGSNEFASLHSDLPSLYDIDSVSNDGTPSWLGGPKWSAANDFYADVGACVNPNSVMPIISSSSSSLMKSPKISLNTNTFRTAVSPPPSPKENKSHLTFSPHQIKIPTMQDKRLPQLTTSLLNNRNTADTIKKDLTTELKVKEEKPTKNGILHSLAPGIGGLTFANTIDYKTFKQTSTQQSTMHLAPKQITNLNTHNGNLSVKRERETSSPLNTIATMQNSNFNNHNANKIHARNILVQNKNLAPVTLSNTNSPVGSPQSNHTAISHSKQSNKIKPIGGVSEFPKPAYSYSCLIAMALKNSRGGSLPVSEIYSFMCEHFPYFKTAPNGWKNSVRHNLSLNKCFEKIEKPATNGGQRKGCLWAMNPAKIAKMDEEVQKWSRKDPMAIRKAMVFPEHLEALERGEMKHGSTGDSDGEGELPSDIEENSDSEQDQEIDDNIIETPESFIDEEEEDHQLERDFEIEVQDIYDAIDMEDDKESLRLAIRQNEIIEMTESDYQSPKRARLNVNYSIAPVGAFEHIQKNTIKQVVQSQQHHHIQHIQQHNFQHQQIAVTQHNRRKMQLVNRIA